MASAARVLIVASLTLTGLAAATACSSSAARGPVTSSTPSKTSPSKTGSSDSAAGRQKTFKLPWNLDRIDQSASRLDHRFHTSATGRGVHVYVLDCMVDVKHAQFGGRAEEGFDAVGGKKYRCADDQGEVASHGTFVAGIIGGKDTGVAPGSSIVSVRSIEAGEGGGSGPVTPKESDARIVRGMNWIADHAKKPAVANLSLAVSGPSSALKAAVNKAIDRGITVVAAAGNNAGDACTESLGGIPGVVTVAASTHKEQHWKQYEDTGSNSGRCVDLYAPGNDITSLQATNGITTATSGATSWAAPHVSGAVVLYLQNHPAAEPAEVHAWLVHHATRDAIHKVPGDTPNLLLNIHGL